MRFAVCWSVVISASRVGGFSGGNAMSGPDTGASRFLTDPTEASRVNARWCSSRCGQLAGVGCRDRAGCCDGAAQRLIGLLGSGPALMMRVWTRPLE